MWSSLGLGMGWLLDDSKSSSKLMEKPSLSFFSVMKMDFSVWTLVIMSRWSWNFLKARKRFSCNSLQLSVWGKVLGLSTCPLTLSAWRASPSGWWMSDVFVCSSQVSLGQILVMGRSLLPTSLNFWGTVDSSIVLAEVQDALTWQTNKVSRAEEDHLDLASSLVMDYLSWPLSIPNRLCNHYCPGR